MSDEQTPQVPPTTASLEPSRAVVVFRPLRLGDLDTIHGLFVEVNKKLSLSDPMARLAENPRQVRWLMRGARQQMMMDRRYFGFIAELDGVCVGYCTGALQESTSAYRLGLYGSLTELFILEAVRRQGIGTRLVENVLSSFHQNGADWIDVSIPPGDEVAERFFERFGFSAASVRLKCSLRALSGE